MTAELIERLNYFQFQYLGAEDLIAQQAYHRDMRRRHNLGPHTAGIITGLSLVERGREGDTPFVDVYVLPGICVDGYGRDIIVLEPVRIDGELFAAYNTDRHLELWIAYDELAARTATGGFAPCTDAESYARVRETYRFAVGTIDPSHDEIVVAGRNAVPAPAGADDTIIPPDESVAFQEFPDNERQARWLVRLGMCHWDGTVRKFRKAATGMLTEGRHYAGFVGDALLSESGALRIAPRTAATDVDLADFATVDGRLQVNGRLVAKKDVLLHGGKLSLQSAGGSDETVPLWLQRLSNPVGSGSDLRIHIGDNPAKNARLTIGPGPAGIPTTATEKVVLGVRGDDKIDIPTGRLRFGAQTRQHIDLWGTDDNAVAPYGIGVQAAATYFRTGGDFYWHLNGQHSDANGDPGPGGTQLMRLSPQGSLFFSNDFRQFLNVIASGQTFGVGVQDLTLYQRSWSDFAWYRGGVHGMGHFDSGGGALAMWLDGASRLSVMGGVTSRSTVSLWGSKLEFLNGTGGTDTDPLEMMRITNAPNRNDLRIVVGDDEGGDDRLTVGPVTGAGFQEKFVVQNNGDVRVAGDLYVRGSKIPPAIDVVAGSYFLNRTSDGDGTIQLTVNSTRIANISEAHITVSLSDIGNQFAATDARWAVSWDGTSIRGGSTAVFPIKWAVSDIDGHLFWFSFVAVLYG